TRSRYLTKRSKRTPLQASVASSFSAATRATRVTSSPPTTAFSMGPSYSEPACCYTTGVGFRSIAPLLSLLALAGMADADDTQPTAYQAAVHLASKIGYRPSASANERRAHGYVARRFLAAGL